MIRTRTGTCWGVLEGFEQDDDKKTTFAKIIGALTTG
jgi:hypothetical protein